MTIFNKTKGYPLPYQAAFDREKAAFLELANRGAGLTPLNYVESERASFTLLNVNDIVCGQGEFNIIESNTIENQYNISTQSLTASQTVDSPLLHIYSSDFKQYVGFKSPALTTSSLYTLPLEDSDVANYVLTTSGKNNGSILSWSQGINPAILDATFILQTPNDSLPNAQALNALSPGIMYLAADTGVVSTIGLPSGELYIGNSDDLPASQLQITFNNLPTLTAVTVADGQVYRGTISGVPEASDALTVVEADIITINTRLAAANFILGSGLKVTWPGAQILSNLETGMVKNTFTPGIINKGVLSIAKIGVDYMAPPADPGTGVAKITLTDDNESLLSIAQAGVDYIAPPAGDQPTTTTNAVAIWGADNGSILNNSNSYLTNGNLILNGIFVSNDDPIGADSSFVGFAAPDVIEENITLVIPGTYGKTDQCLASRNDDEGTLRWLSVITGPTGEDTTTDRALVIWDGTDGTKVQNSVSLLSEEGFLTVGAITLLDQDTGKAAGLGPSPNMTASVGWTLPPEDAKIANQVIASDGDSALSFISVVLAPSGDNPTTTNALAIWGDDTGTKLINSKSYMEENGNLLVKTINLSNTPSDPNNPSVGFGAPDAITTSVIWELPPADATQANQAMCSDGNSKLSFQSVVLAPTGENPTTTNALAVWGDDTGTKLINSMSYLNAQGALLLNAITLSQTPNNPDNNSVGFFAPDASTITTNVIWTLPSADATVANQALCSNADEVLSFQSVILAPTGETPVTPNALAVWGDDTGTKLINSVSYISPGGSLTVLNIALCDNPTDPGAVVSGFTFSNSVGQSISNILYDLPTTAPTKGQVLGFEDTVIGDTYTLEWASAGGNSNAYYILQQKDNTLPNAQALNDIEVDSILKVIADGVITAAVEGEDYTTPEELESALDPIESAISTIEEEITTLESEVTGLGGTVLTILAALIGIPDYDNITGGDQTGITVSRSLLDNIDFIVNIQSSASTIDVSTTTASGDVSVYNLDLPTSGVSANTYNYPTALVVNEYGILTSVTGGNAPPPAIIVAQGFGIAVAAGIDKYTVSIDATNPGSDGQVLSTSGSALPSPTVSWIDTVNQITQGTGISVSGTSNVTVAIADITGVAGSFISPNVTINGQGQVATIKNGIVIGQAILPGSAVIINSVTVLSTTVQANSNIQITGVANPFVPAGILRIDNIVPNTSFDIYSSDLLDTSTINWVEYL